MTTGLRTVGVKKYAPDVNDVAVKGIVKHLGIALKNRDASFVACTDKSERDRVRDSFLEKKLALNNSDAELDKAIMEVCVEDEAGARQATGHLLLSFG